VSWISRQPLVTTFVVDDSGIYALMSQLGSGTNADTVARIALDTGAVTVLASGQDKARGLAVDATHVYWTNTSTLTDGTVMRIPKDGSGVAETFAANQDHPDGIAVDAMAVYWTNDGTKTAADQDGNFNDVNGALMKRAKDGQASPAMLFPAAEPTKLIAVDDTNVFWFERGTGPSSSSRMMRANKDGSAAAELSPVGGEGAADVALDAENVYWTAAAQVLSAPSPGGATLAPANAGLGGGVRSVSKGGGTPSTIGVGAVLAVASDGTNLYWASAVVDAGGSTHGWILRAAPGASPVAIAPTGLAFAMAVDATSVYWLENSNSGTSLKKTPK
jgi:hypothetical protein